jgi:hypothetical protein
MLLWRRFVPRTARWQVPSRSVPRRSAQVVFPVFLALVERPHTMAMVQARRNTIAGPMRTLAHRPRVEN